MPEEGRAGLANPAADAPLPDPSTLSGYVRHALAGSPAVTVARARAQAARFEVEEKRAAFWPQVTLSDEALRKGERINSSQNPNDEFDVNAFSTVELKATFSLAVVDLAASASYDASVERYLSTLAEVRRAEQDLRLRAATTFIDAAEALERFVQAGAQREFYRLRAEREAGEVAAGTLRASLQAETLAELARAESDYRIAIRDYEIRVGAFCRLVRDVACPAVPGAGFARALPRPAALGEEERAAVLTAPDIRVLEFTTRAALREVERAAAGNRPRVSLVAEAREWNQFGDDLTGSADTDTGEFGLLLEWDIYSGGRVLAETGRRRFEAEALEAELDGQIRDRTGQLEVAYAALNALWENDRMLAEVVAVRARAVELARTELAAGLIGETDLAEARLNLVEAETRRRSIRRSFVSASLARARATGALDDGATALVTLVFNDRDLARRALNAR